MSKKLSLKKNYGDWVVIGEVYGVQPRTLSIKCKCGVEKEVPLTNLVHGKSTQCRSCSVTTHGKSNQKDNRLYRIWHLMKRRTKSDENYKHINVCKKWQKSFAKFEKWAIKNGYEDTLSIDRKKNNGDYKPSNCRWVAQNIQSQNTRLIQKNNTSGFRGVTFDKQRKKWIGQITHNSKRVGLGSFEIPEEAGRAFDRYVMDNDLEQPLNFDDYRDVVVDSDHILYNVTESKQYKCGFEDDVEDFGDADDWGSTPKVSLKPYKEHFKRIVEDYITTAEVESICYNWTIGKVRVILSDTTNFRYDIFPDYKKGRPPSPEIRKRLKKWAMKKYQFEPNTEADEVCCYYVREEGAIGFTTDKDVYMTEGKWYRCYHTHRDWKVNSKKQAEYFFKQQILAGDSTDGIPSIDGVGLMKAKQLMDKYGDSYEAIFSIFQDKTKVLGKTHRKVSYSKKYATTMAQLVDMKCWSPKKGIRLWKMPKTK